MKLLSGLFIAACFFLLSCAGSNTETSSQNLSLVSFEKMRLEENTVVLDVRTPKEIAEGKIPGAVALDFYGAQFDEELAKLDKSKTYLVYCRSGNRSGQTLEKMKALKFSKSFHLAGGYSEWSKEMSKE